jgi:calcium-dependent protein kinase
MLYGFPPFHGSPDKEIHNKIKKGFNPVVKEGFGPWFPKATKTSESARDLISKMLNFDPVARLSAAEVLEHPWMTGGHGVDPLDTVLKNLNNFSAEQKLKKAILEKMGAQMDGKDIEALEKSFDKIDSNHDGKVTINELQTALKSLDSAEVKQAETLQQLLETADVDGDGALSLKELTMAAANRRLLAKEERLWKLFSQLDADGSGTVSAVELKAQLGSVDADDMIAEIDEDGDGQVNYEEFLVMWRDKTLVSHLN